MLGMASMTNFHTIALSFCEDLCLSDCPVPHSLWPHLFFQGQKDTSSRRETDRSFLTPGLEG